jgi:hypothetical protein
MRLARPRGGEGGVRGGNGAPRNSGWVMLPSLPLPPPRWLLVSHHHTQCRIIIHSVTSSYRVSHQPLITMYDDVTL